MLKLKQMYPNQQQPGQQQTPPPQSPGGFNPQPSYPQQPQQPQQPGYGPQPTPTYAVDYLDQIAPPPQNPKFLSGVFGKAVIGLGVVFVLAVSLIVAFGNTKKTADLEQVSVRLGNFQSISKANQKNIKNGKLLATNSLYQIWIANADRDAGTLLAQAGVKKKDMSKDMLAKESETATELSAKFLDAKLNAELDRVYAREMAYQAELLLTMYTKMSKSSQAQAIRDYAKKMSENLTPIQKAFDGFDESTT